MNVRIIEGDERIDGKTSRSIRDAVGERLRRTLRPDPSPPNPRLQHLLNQLRQQENDCRGAG